MFAKKFFNTLGIKERTYRMAVSKLNEVEVMEDNREAEGKEAKIVLKKEKSDRLKNEAHIDRSHYCRSSTTRNYLHPDLTNVCMFVQDQNDKGCLLQSTKFLHIQKSF